MLISRRLLLIISVGTLFVLGLPHSPVGVSGAVQQRGAEQQQGMLKPWQALTQPASTTAIDTPDCAL